MDNPRPEKVAVVAEVRAKLDAADAALLTEYRGLNVAATSELRRALREAGGEYKIYKNTLVRFAARDLGLELDAMLTGSTAIAFVEGDPVNVAKALRDFSKTNPALVLKGGLLGDKVLDGDGIRALADVEPREVILAKLAGAMAAPMQQFAGLLQAVPRNFAYGLKALIDTKPPAPVEAEAPAAAEAEAPAPVEAEAPAAAETGDAPAEPTTTEAPSEEASASEPVEPELSTPDVPAEESAAETPAEPAENQES